MKMTNEEYRQYIHNMYKKNFLDKGKKPKWIQIFGDSFGHFVTEGTWGYELSQLIGCPIISFARAGGNNIRTLNYFHEYYDEDCLNILLITEASRLYINDEIIATCSENKIFGSYYDSLTKNAQKNIDLAVEYYCSYLHDYHIQNIIKCQLFKPIINLKNTFIINCFPDLPDSFCPTAISNKFKKFYYIKYPDVLDTPLFNLQLIQFYENKINEENISSDNIKNLELTFKKYDKDYKNHLSKNSQKNIGKVIYEILTSGNFYLPFKAITPPTDDEEILKINSTVWPKEESYRKKTIELLNIQLSPFHTKFLNEYYNNGKK